MTAPRLSRAAVSGAGAPLPAAPVRIVHLGVGAFHRSHQAWYTARSADAAQWGIAAFTGRSGAVAAQLTPQDGLFTLVERGPQVDGFEVVGSIAEVHGPDAYPRLIELLAAPETAIVTLTVTEAGYHLRPDGALDLDDPAVAGDVAALRSGAAARTPVGRLVAGLAARRAAGSPALAVVPCDNLPDNGPLLRRAVEALGRAAGIADAAGAASFVTTSVDRITPQTTPADIAAVAAATGWHDEGAVVAEPFTDWILAGEFPGGRPAWETAGAVFVDDVTGYTQRKLFVLNGGHLVLAFEGLLRGRATVAEAMADPACRAALERFWDEAAAALPAGVETVRYRAALVERFSNTRIEHRLAQIAVDTMTKLQVRVLPVLHAELAAGRSGAGSAAVVSAWAACVRAGLLPGLTSTDAALPTLLDGADPRDTAAIAAAVAAAAPVAPVA